MNAKKEKLLNVTYHKWMQAGLYDLPLAEINEYIDPNIMGYGIAIDEKVLSISDYRELIKTQREQAVGLDMSIEVTPVFRSISNKEDSAIFVDEITVCIVANGNKQKLFLRITTMLEYCDRNWKVVHWHGSIPTETTGETDTWLVNEWKRKNEELQKLVEEKTSELLDKNRELEIESSLEKVRSVAMAMREPADMLDVCQTISLQLKSLGIKEIRNVQTAIFYEQSGTYMNYEYYAKHKKTIITETSYTNHDMHIEFARKMLKGKGEFFVTHIKGKKVKDWIAYQKTTNVFIDKYLETASSINYYWFSLGPVALGMSTYSPLADEEINLFKRFVKVFELAYQRYLDIEKAEAQAKEAEIELALERVRARTMAMQKSEELNDVVMTLFGQMKDLEIDIDGININILNDQLTGFDSWFTAPGYTKAVCLFTPYFDTPVMNDIFNAVKSKQDLLSKIYQKKEKDAYFSYLYEHSDYKNLPDERKKMILGAEGWCLSVGIANNIGISIHSYTDRSFSEKENDILKRFAKVFEQTYTRFLDLQKAEVQAKEAEIELALERVRARTMGMQKSDELKEVIKIVYQQLIQLNIKLDHTGFVVDYTPGGEWHFWIADEQDIPAKITHPYFESVWANQFNEAKEKGEDFFVTNLNFEQKNKFYQELLSHIPGLPEKSKEFYLNCPGLAATTVVLDNIGLYIENFEGIPYTYEENNILMRFGKVFQQTYTRFLDLQRVEAQNKIIQAENERKSKELEDARQLQLSMLPKELPKLPHLDISVYMKTATEVGGDYYDYNVDADGTLTFVVGDATGHGMMSGMMVSIMKSFFISNKSNLELKTFFESANNSIKEMQLGRLMMACMGVQITSEKIIATNAGMPSLIYFRNKSQKAGEFVSHNFPLGGMKGTIYSLKKIRYEKGDTLLLMSDGFAELRNDKNEQYGYPRIIKEFKSVVQKSSTEVVEYLKNSASQWINGLDPDDDVTFVVIKVK